MSGHAEAAREWQEKAHAEALKSALGSAAYNLEVVSERLAVVVALCADIDSLDAVLTEAYAAAAEVASAQVFVNNATDRFRVVTSEG